MRRVILAWVLVLAVTPAVAAPPAPRMPPECKAALARADRALAKGDAAAAVAALDEAAPLAAADPPEGGECTARVLAKRAELATKAGDHAAAARHLRQAAHRTVEQHALWRQLAAARVAAETKAKHPRSAERIGKLPALDAQVAALDRRPAVGKAGLAAAAAQLDEAIAALEADKDPVRAAWARAVEAKVRAASGDAAGARAIAEPLAAAPDAGAAATRSRATKTRAAPRPAFVRIAAHEALALVAVAAKDVEGEARAVLSVDALRAELAGRTPEERRFARSREVERACARYEKAEGEGHCAVLALRATGQLSFSDPSRGRPKKTASTDDIERAQRQYSPVVEACVREVAKSHVDGELFENASIKIGWSVRGDGRTGEVEIEPRRYDPALGPCVRERVAWFRYPRWTDGQVHNVVIPYQLEVTERFGGRSR